MTTIGRTDTSWTGASSLPDLEPTNGAGISMGSLELVIEEMLERNDTMREANRAARDAGREARTAARMGAVAERREAADFALASGIVGGAVKIASASISMGSTLSGAGTSAETPELDAASTTGGEDALGADLPTPDAAAPEAPADAAGAPAEGAPPAGGEGDGSRTAGLAGASTHAVEGLGSVGTAVLDRLGAAATADADVASAYAETLGELASDRAEDRSSAIRHAEKELDLYARILEAKRRAEEAATRA